MDLSIVIVSYNTKELLDDCLRSLYNSLKGSVVSHEVIVIDNGSTDGTREILKSNYKKVHTIFNRENIGFGRANNQGIKRATGDWVLLLNSDTIVINDAIPKLFAFAKQHPKNFIGPKLLNADRSPQTSCGPFLSPLIVFAALFLKGDHIGLTRWSPRRVREVDWVSGAALMGPKKNFMDDLLFDEKIFLYMEEIDLLYRAKLRGIKTLFYPRSVIVHLGTGSSTNYKKGPVLQIYKGLLYFYSKHYAPWKLRVLRIMLKVKAMIGWIVGNLSGSRYLKETYAEAYKIS